MQSCSIPAVSSENQPNEGTYAARHVTQIGQIKDLHKVAVCSRQEGKVDRGGIGSGAAAVAGGIFRHTCDNDGQYIVIHYNS